MIEGLTPSNVSGDVFRRFRNDRDGAFQKWAETTTTGCRRRFQVRRIADVETPEVSNTDHEGWMCTFRVLVAYPQINRDGPDGALDRDDAMDSDQHQINKAIGMDGRANLAPPYPDAAWRQEGNGERSRITEPIEGDGVDFVQIILSYSYLRTMV